jgi:hypothetical protein
MRFKNPQMTPIGADVCQFYLRKSMQSADNTSVSAPEPWSAVHVAPASMLLCRPLKVMLALPITKRAVVFPSDRKCFG